MTDQIELDAQWVFIKTPRGAEEIQQRTLRLALLQRRVLLLVDGRRTVAELQKLAGNADAQALLGELLALECVERVAAPAAPVPAQAAQPAQPAQAASAPDAGPLAGLPPPETRSAEQVDMARHFMINTINRMLEQNSRLSLVNRIFQSVGAAELRTHYPAWEEAITSSWMGRKRIDELRTKLFAVL